MKTFAEYKTGTKFTSLPKKLQSNFNAAEKHAERIHGECTIDNAQAQMEQMAAFLGEKYPTHLNFNGRV